MNWKYLISKSFLKTNNSLVRISKFLSLFGMLVGSFSIVIALSIMNGFELLIKNKLIGFEGDLRISGNFNFKDIYNIDGIKKISPFIERKGVIENSEEHAIVTFKAINTENITGFYNIPFNGSSPDYGQIMIGQDLAIRLGIDIGDSISIFSPLDQNFGFGLPKKRSMLVCGIFFSKVLDYDNRYVFITLKDGKQLFKRKSKYFSLDVRIKENIDLNMIKNNIIIKLKNNVSIQSWTDLNKSLVDAMKLEKLGAIIVLSLIFLVASFNLAMSLSLNSIQNLKEIGLLKAIGVSKKSIKEIIIIMGFKLAGIGIIYGVSLGIIIIFLQNQFGLIPIPSEIYFLEFLPMYIDIYNIIIVLLISLTFVFITSYISGENISKISIIKAIKWTK